MACSEYFARQNLFSSKTFDDKGKRCMDVVEALFRYVKVSLFAVVDYDWGFYFVGFFLNPTESFVSYKRKYQVYDRLYTMAATLKVFKKRIHV